MNTSLCLIAAVALFLLTSAGALTSTSGWTLLAWSEGGDDSTEDQQVVVVDLFDTSVADIADYRQYDHKVICYYSAGTAEDWRDDVAGNQSAWTALAAGGMSQWSGEVWLDITQLTALKALMLPRLKLAKAKGCDGVEPDNTDCFTNPDECTISGSDSQKRAAQFVYNKWTADTAHSLGLIAGLKNTGDLAGSLSSIYDFAIVEQCLQYNECDSYSPFKELNKPIFGVEYQALSAAQCLSAKNDGVQMKYCSGSPGAGTCQNNALQNCFVNPTWD